MPKQSDCGSSSDSEFVRSPFGVLPFVRMRSAVANNSSINLPVYIPGPLRRFCYHFNAGEQPS